MDQSVIPVPTALMIANSQPKLENGVDIFINNVSIHVTDKTSAELLAMVLKVAADVK